MPPRAPLTHLLSLFFPTLRLTGTFVGAWWYWRTKAAETVGQRVFESMTGKEKRRFKHYFYGTTYLAGLFGLLHGRRRAAGEKSLFLHLSALAYFFDDLVDTIHRHPPPPEPEEFGKQHDDARGLALHFLNILYEKVPADRLELFKALIDRVFRLESAGRQQHVHGMSETELAALTAEKGGCSVMLFRTVFGAPLSEQEITLWFCFGHFIQLCDDVFDLWFDLRDGTATLATYFAEKNRIADLVQCFEKQVTDMREAFCHSGCRPRGIRRAEKAAHFLVAITRVCLQHYSDLQKNGGTLPLESRRQLVVDMERWPNRRRAALELLFRH